MRRALRLGASVGAAVAAVLFAPSGAAKPSAYVVDPGVRLRADVAEPGVPRAAAAEVRAFRGEYAAFQIVVEAGDAPLDGVEIATQPMAGGLALDVFFEWCVGVRARSRNERADADALPFTRAAAPPDATVLGRVPDALVPLHLAPKSVYPTSIRAGERAIFWLEAFVPETAEPGLAETSVHLTAGRRPLVEVPVRIQVLDQTLPYRAVEVFAYYERRTLEERFVDADLAEKRLVTMLHAHHVDAVTQITRPEHVDRVRGALDGSWFSRQGRYRGPGASEPASLAALGAYGTLGDPSDDGIRRVRAIAGRLPGDVRDVFVYAVDEVCESPRGPRWRALLRDAGLAPRVVAGHTCWEDPREQRTDLVMIPAQAFDPDSADAARAEGKEVWIYNGQLPFAGPPVLDVPLPSLTVNGWIASTFDVGRWFYWETIFWHDGNRGGRGPTDVFSNPETFHNADGDTALYDGLLAFPGRSKPRIGGPDLGYDGVIPSMRLKSLRRGVEDAGLIGLAAEVDPVRAAAIVRRVVKSALDEVDATSRTRLELDPSRLAALRDELRDIALGAPTPSGPPGRREVSAGLERVRELRRAERRAAPPASAGGDRAAWGGALVPALLFSLGLFVAALPRARSAAARRPP